MSFDLKYEAVCDHRTHLETHQVERDRLSVLLPRPVIRNTFHVYLNGFEVKPTHPQLGWFLTQDPNGATPDYYKLLFKKKLHAYDDVLQLSYQTAESNCRRCHGKRLYFDMALDVGGKFKLVIDESKLTQDLRKGVLTVKGTNRYATWYGSSLINLIGTKVVNDQVIAMKMQQEVSQLLQNLLKLQVSQAQLQQVTLREMILQILGVEATPLDPAATTWVIEAAVSTRAGNEVTVTQDLDLYKTIKVPKPR